MTHNRSQVPAAVERQEAVAAVAAATAVATAAVAAMAAATAPTTAAAATAAAATDLGGRFRGNQSRVQRFCSKYRRIRVYSPCSTFRHNTGKIVPPHYPSHQRSNLR